MRSPLFTVERCNFPSMEFIMKSGAKPVWMPLIGKAIPDLEEECTNIVEYIKKMDKTAVGTVIYRALCFVVNQVTKR